MTDTVTKVSDEALDTLFRRLAAQEKNALRLRIGRGRTPFGQIEKRAQLCV